jgi:hypothetical protein
MLFTPSLACIIPRSLTGLFAGVSSDLQLGVINLLDFSEIVLH